MKGFYYARWIYFTLRQDQKTEVDEVDRHAQAHNILQYISR